MLYLKPICLFRYSVSERRWTQMLTSALEEGSAPHSRYHHASSLLAHESGSQGGSHSFMLVVGGVTPDGVAGDTWSLNLSSLIWREHPVSLHVLPKASVYSGFSTLHSNIAPPPTELSAAPCSGPHLDGTPRLLGALDWWVFSRERLQPPSAGVQPSVWELDYCSPHWHATDRFGRPYS